MKKLSKATSTFLQFVPFYLVAFAFLNSAIYMFGLFYYLDFNPIHWSPNARAVVSIINIVVLMATLFGFYTIED